VLLRAGEDLVMVGEREGPLALPAPRRFHLGRMQHAAGSWGQAVVRALKPGIDDAIEKRTLGGEDADHASPSEVSAVMDCRQDGSGLSDS